MAGGVAGPHAAAEAAPTPEQSRLTMLLSNAQRSGGGAPAGTPPPAAAPATRPPLLTPSFFQQAKQAVRAGPTLP